MKILKDDEFNDYLKAEIIAKKMLHGNLFSKDMDLETATEIILKLQKEKEKKELLSDAQIDYNDEIIDIEYIGEKETIDIGVSGDNLFYCNDILTKNSYGTAHSADFILGVTETDEMREQGIYFCRVLKSRYGLIDNNSKFTIKVDKDKQIIKEIPRNLQMNLVDESIIDVNKKTYTKNENDDLMIKFEKDNKKYQLASNWE